MAELENEPLYIQIGEGWNNKGIESGITKHNPLVCSLKKLKIILHTLKSGMEGTI